MKKDKISLVFFGSGPVAAESLKLLSSDFLIEAVITKPTTIHEMQAACPGATLYSVSNKSELDSLLDSSVFTSKVGVLIDFGIIVSQTTINTFEYGIINSHFSLLPKLRGADPISFAILEGQHKTGVSMMLLVEAMDEGPLLSQAEIDIDSDDTTPSLTTKLIELSDAQLKSILPLWLHDVAVAAPQEAVTIANSPTPSYTRKLSKADGVVDWSKSAEQISREIRAFHGWPKSRTNLGGIDCVLTKARPGTSDFGKPGELNIEALNKKMLLVQCGKGHLCIDMLKPAGKKEMSAEAFLAGYKNKLTA